MERIFAATEDGYYFFPKEASGNPLLNKQIEAMVPTVKSAPGNHHQEITGDPLPEHRVGAAPAPPVPPDYETSSWEPRGWPRQPMQDDSGATTGLRRRPDYGKMGGITKERAFEKLKTLGITDIKRKGTGYVKRHSSDYWGWFDPRELLVEIESKSDSNANSKGASALYVIALEASSRKAARKKATMYVTELDWDAKNGLKIAKFAFGSDISKALRLPNLTAKSVSKQLLASPFRVKAKPIIPTA